MEYSMNSPTPMPGMDNNYSDYSIRIDTIANGYLVQVGCKTFAFLTRESMITALNAYFAEPAAVIRDWENNKVLPA